MDSFNKNIGKDPYEVGFSIVGTFRLLTELEDQLGSLAPAANSLLKKAIELTENGGKPVDLFEDNDNLVLLRLVNVKFNSLISSGILDVMTAAKTQRAIESTNWIMKEIEKSSDIQPSSKIAGLGLDLNAISSATIGMNTVQIAHYIAEQLFKIGKSDVSESVLQDILIAVSENHNKLKLHNSPISQNINSYSPHNTNMKFPPFTQPNQSSFQGMASSNSINSYMAQNTQANTIERATQRLPFVQECENKPPFSQQNQPYAALRPIAPQNNDPHLSRSSFSSAPALFPSGAASTEIKKDTNQNEANENIDNPEDKGKTALSLLQSAYDNEEDSSKDKKDMDNLSLQELQELLSNFKKLSSKEQQNLTDYLKRLEATDNKKVTKLRSMMHSSKPPTPQRKEQTPKNIKANLVSQRVKNFGNKVNRDDIYDPMSPSAYDESFSKRPISFDNSRQGQGTMNKPIDYGENIPISNKDTFSPNVQDYYSTERKALSNFSRNNDSLGSDLYHNRAPDSQRQPLSRDFAENRPDFRQPLLPESGVDSGFQRSRPSLLSEPNMEPEFSRVRQPLLPKPVETDFPHTRPPMSYEPNRDPEYQQSRQSMPHESSRDYGFQDSFHEPNREYEFSASHQEPNKRQDYMKSQPMPREPSMDSRFSRQPLLQKPNMEQDHAKLRQPLLPEPISESRYSGGRPSFRMESSSRDQPHSNLRQPLLSEPRNNDLGMQNPRSSLHSEPYNEPRYSGDGHRPNARPLLPNPSNDSGPFSDEFRPNANNPMYSDESDEYSNAYQKKDRDEFYSERNDTPYASRKTLLPDPGSDRGFNSGFDRNIEGTSRQGDMKERPLFQSNSPNFSGNRFPEHDFSTNNFGRNRSTVNQFAGNEPSFEGDNRPTTFSQDFRSFSSSDNMFSGKPMGFSQQGSNFTNPQRDLESNQSSRFSSGFVSDSFRNFSSSGNLSSTKGFDSFGNTAGQPNQSHHFYESGRQNNFMEDKSNQRSFQGPPQRFQRGRGPRGRNSPRK